jgi:glycosyltransferase involved in cell wall biosynthesis
MSVLVSICIPTYQQTIYLERCLKSILSQDFKDFELIISDDTANDTIEKFAAATLGSTPYQYFKNKPALGTPENWNAAIHKAKGKYIKIMHHDDFFTDSKSLGIMVSTIENQKLDFLFSQTDVWHINSDLHHLHKISDNAFKLIVQQPLLLFFKNIIGAPSTTLYKKELSLAYDKKFKWLVDVDLYLQYLLRSKHIGYIKEPLICTIHGAENQVTSLVEKNKPIQISEHILLFVKIFPEIKKTEPFKIFFDYLFFEYKITSYQELLAIVPEASLHEVFFKQIIDGVNRHRKWKYLKKRFYESRYNNYIFKLEQYL